MLDPALYDVVRLGCAILLLAGAWHKFSAPAQFAEVVAGYAIAPRRFAKPLARIVPLAEAAAAAAAILLRGPGLALSAALLGGYALVLSLNILRGRAHVDCGCRAFGRRAVTLQWPMVARNVALAAVASVAALVGRSTRPVQPLDVLTIVASLLVLTLLYASFDEFLALNSKSEAWRQA